MDDKNVEVLPEAAPPKKIPTPPQNVLARWGEKVFQVHTRGSTWFGELRAGLVLFMVSAYILFLNPLILSGSASGFNTGMPSEDIVLATAVSTGIATIFMGVAGNYPWVVSVQLGTNSYFVNSILGVEDCGYHATMRGADTTCFNIPCTCVPAPNGNGTIPNVILDGTCSANTTNTCQGTKIPYENALAATFIEGLVFILICITGMRSVLIKFLPHVIMMAGAAGIGVFIAFVGAKDATWIVAANYPTLLALNEEWPYTPGGWGAAGYHSGIGWNQCVMYFDGPPYGPVCPWLSVGGLIFTGILMVWNINGAFIIGIFFTMFISWGIFPQKISNGGLVPDQVVSVAKFSQTAGSLDFNWAPNTGKLVGAFITFLYLDFIGSCITFVSLGNMAGLINSKGDMPRCNIAFLADGVGSMLGGLLGTSALTTYVESASAMREGGRTGVTAIVCAALFFLSIVFWPLFSVIPNLATGPILMLIGVVIFMESVVDINWADVTDAIPAFATILGMAFTNNIAYGVIGGIALYIPMKFVTYKLFDFQKNWPGSQLYAKWTANRSMFCSVPGWNVDEQGNRMDNLCVDDQDLSLLTLYNRYQRKKNDSLRNVATSVPSTNSTVPLAARSTSKDPAV